MTDEILQSWQRLYWKISDLLKSLKYFEKIYDDVTWHWLIQMQAHFQNKKEFTKTKIIFIQKILFAAELLKDQLTQQ